MRWHRKTNPSKPRAAWHRPLSLLAAGVWWTSEQLSSPPESVTTTIRHQHNLLMSECASGGKCLCHVSTMTSALRGVFTLEPALVWNAMIQHGSISSIENQRSIDLVYGEEMQTHNTVPCSSWHSRSHQPFLHADRDTKVPAWSTQSKTACEGRHWNFVLREPWRAKFMPLQLEKPH